MKRRNLLRRLRGHPYAHGCELLREGGNHSWWHNADQKLRSAEPRQSEINQILARKLCRDIGIPSP